MSRLLTLLLTLLACALAGCGHRDLKAPCSASDGPSALAYGEPETAPTNACGPMRPINTPFDTLQLDPPKAADTP